MYAPRIYISSKGSLCYDRTLDSDTEIAHLRKEHGDNEPVVTLTIVSWVSLLGDSPVDSYKPAFIIERFLQLLLRDYRGTIATFSSLAHDLLKGLVRDHDGNIIVPYQKEFESLPIYREYLSFFRTRDPRVLQYILSFLLFAKKGHYKDAALESDAFRKWLQVEDRLTGLVLPPWISNLHRILDVCFRSWEFPEFLPKHGSGAVADRGVRGVNAKNDSFAVHRKIDYLYLRERFSEHHDIQLLPTPDGEVAELSSSSDISKLMFVAKDYKSSRSICMEPIGFMWAQQAVRLVYERWLSESLLGNHVFLSDQTRNQEASAFGSRTGQVDTIDLSSASDCVSWDLVKQIFPAKVLKHLLGTRTSKVELPNGAIRVVRKYAPMGSALCFPVQSTIYAAIALMVGICRYYGVDWHEPGCLDGLDIAKMHTSAFSRSLGYRGSQFSHYLCYGDDIIVDSRLTEDVITALTSLGFAVNTAKSFIGSEAFRESCGEYHFDGKSVSPYFLKTKEVSSRVSITSIAGIVDLANRALDFSYATLRRTLIQFIMHYPIEGIARDSTKNPILFASLQEDGRESCAVLCAAPRNTHLRKRVFDARLIGLLSGTNILYQRDEYESIAPGPRVKRRISKEFDMYRYATWWRTRAYGGEMDLIDSIPMTHDALEVGICRRWTAC